MNSNEVIDRAKRVLLDFHQDESGESGQLSGIMTLAIAALLLVVLLTLGYFGINYIKEIIFGQDKPQNPTPPAIQ